MLNNYLRRCARHTGLLAQGKSDGCDSAMCFPLLGSFETFNLQPIVNPGPYLIVCAKKRPTLAA